MNKIMIAEDEPAIANLVKTALDGPDYCCTWAADGITAADLLEQKPFDLVLLDIMLPGADGYEVLEYCRTLEVPVIFLTAKGTVEDRVRGLRLGAEDYITKPFELMELLARVETVLRRCGKTGRVLPLPPDIEIDTAAPPGARHAEIYRSVGKGAPKDDELRVRDLRPAGAAVGLAGVGGDDLCDLPRCLRCIDDQLLYPLVQRGHRCGQCVCGRVRHHAVCRPQTPPRRSGGGAEIRELLSVDYIEPDLCGGSALRFLITHGGL